MAQFTDNCYNYSIISAERIVNLKKEFVMKRLFAFIIILMLTIQLSACGLTANEKQSGTEQTQPTTDVSSNLQFKLSDIPSYSGTPYCEVNNNQPFFHADELTTESFKRFSELDSLGRCGVAYACIGTDSLPTEERVAIGMIKPSGWHTVRYDDLIEDTSWISDQSDNQLKTDTQDSRVFINIVF